MEASNESFSALASLEKIEKIVANSANSTIDILGLGLQSKSQLLLVMGTLLFFL